MRIFVFNILILFQYILIVNLIKKSVLSVSTHQNHQSKDFLSKMFALSKQERHRHKEKLSNKGKIRLQGVGVRGRLVCGQYTLNSTKIKLVDVDPRPDRDDLMAETKTNEDGYFQLFGATREETDIETILKIYHDCLDIKDDCQRKVTWQIPSQYHNNGTLNKWFDIGTVNMELIFPFEERDCRH